ncbi:MAG: DUF5069 domain-containing protein [Candidatus Latescibacterota bacterium]
MDLRFQPPRRPSNAGLGGIVGLARMADKARAHNEETLGEYKYGDTSGLDREILAFIRMAAAEFAAAAAERTDPELGELVGERAGRSAAEIAAFNREHLEREPQDELHVRLLRERLARYAPERTDVRTVFASIELDDWGAFREKDLTAGPPRTPYLRLAGCVGVARMADKARAWKCGRLGEYRYGDDSNTDRLILSFLGVSAADFALAAWANPNDLELGEWVAEHRDRTPGQVLAFNAELCSRGKYPPASERFRQRRAQVCPDCTWVETWFDLMDWDDEHSFGLVDLGRHAPRSPYDSSIGGVSGLARMIDKGRAHNGGTLGDYWYGEDSGVDRRILEFLGLSAAQFAAALAECATDAEVVAWLDGRLERSPQDKEELNCALHELSPSGEALQERFRRQVAGLDPARGDITTWFACMQLEDRITFARLKAGV